MSTQSWWQRAIAAINREYERRIRRASLVTEYGANHHGHDHDDHEDGEAAAIMNVPRGTRLGLSAHPESPSASDHPSE